MVDLEQLYDFESAVKLGSALANPIRIEAVGCVSAPDGPGLGLDLDWKQIERDASLVIDTDTMS